MTIEVEEVEVIRATEVNEVVAGYDSQDWLSVNA